MAAAVNSPLLTLFMKSNKNGFTFSRSKLITLGCCTLLSITSIVALYELSDVPNKKKNGFRREYRNNPFLSPMYSKALNLGGYYISGLSNSYIYLSNYSDPLILMRYDYELNFISSHNIGKSDSARQEAVTVKVDSPYIYVINRETSEIHLYSLFGKSHPKLGFHNSLHPKFTAASPLSPTTFIVRAIDTQLNQYVLAKIATENQEVKFSYDALQKQIDGFLDIDGQLLYEADSNCVIYVYYYRNQFICLDSNLNVVYKANSIDTNRFSKLGVKKINSSKFTAISSPQIFINAASYIANGKLFIKSDMMADNEDRRLFGKGFVIDEYDLKDGRYIHSFYLSRMGKRKFDDFQILGNRLIAIQEDYLVEYDLTF